MATASTFAFVIIALSDEVAFALILPVIFSSPAQRLSFP